MKATLFSASLFPSLIFSALAAQEESRNASPPAATINGEQSHFFESKIRPALIKHCYQCHAEEGDQVKGGLLLDTRESTLFGGDTGPAVVPFDPGASLLYQAITYEDDTLEMPPKYPLDAAVVADFRTWIEMGAPDPRDRRADSNAPSTYTNTIDPEEGRKHWAYRPPVKPDLPAAPTRPDWAVNDIDLFVATSHEREGFPAPKDTDPATLLRRLHFDLAGLPPTSAEASTFLAAWETDPDKAVEEKVDELLASERFGEKWGRHWLDVARYAESAGKEVNATFPHAWRYRDYVIDSFNGDKAFDRFIVEQIAGDLLDAATDEERAEQLVATGFLAIGTKGLNEQNARQFRFDLVDEQIDTTTQAFLATTAACARCHDHKYDPFSMGDYYAMAGIFLSSETLFGTAEALQNRKATELISLPGHQTGSGEDRSLGDLIEMEVRLEILRERRNALADEAREARRAGDSDRASRSRVQILGVQNQIGITERTVSSYGEEGRALPLAMGMRDRSEPFDSQILIRGEEDNPTRERVPRGFPEVLRTGNEPPISTEASGRLEMAHWIASPENPLTSRVLANRVWAWLFGEGLVSSVDNFGISGERPSHPDLLDHLAIRFLELDWSVKELVREIATSRTYRMSSAFDAEAFQQDPENRFLWRANPRRLQAEAIRDSVLAASGRLDLSRPEGSLVALAGDGFVGRGVSEAQINTESSSRSVYLPIVRGLVPEALGLFDFSDPSLLSGKREITTVPSQALYLMNSDFILLHAEAMADHLWNDLGLRGTALADEAFHRCFTRPPSDTELRKSKHYIERFVNTAKASGMPEEEANRLALVTFCQSLMASAEFRYLN